MASFIQLKELFNDLFTKVKARDIVSGEVNAGNNNKKLILKRKDNSSQIDINFNNVALLDKENNFTQNNKFKDVIIDDGIKSSIIATGTTTESAFEGIRFTGFRGLTNAKFSDKFISHLRVYIADNVTVQTVQDLHIWAVEKGSNRESDTIREQIPAGTPGNNYTIVGDTRNRYIDIPINKTYNYEVYFVVGGFTNGTASNGRRFKAFSFTGNNSTDIDNIVNTNIRPEVGNRPELQNNSYYCAKMELFGRLRLKDIYEQNNASILEIQQAISRKIDVSEVGNDGNKIPRLVDGAISSELLPESTLGADKENTFTNINIFENHSPRVKREFTRAFINSNIDTNRISTYNADRYFGVINEKYRENNKQISHILLPIRGVNIGDRVPIDFFVFNNNNSVTHNSPTVKDYPIVDIEIADCKCAKIDVNINSGTDGIGFGFAVLSNNNSIGVACNTFTTGNDNVWSQSYKPTVGTRLTANSRVIFPYKIVYETESELVTRFELENVTQMYPRMVGELKQLAYDAGDILEEDGHRWLKANGQSITKENYPHLYIKMNTANTRKGENEEIELPNIESNIGYYYICAK